MLFIHATNPTTNLRAGIFLWADIHRCQPADFCIHPNLIADTDPGKLAGGRTVPGEMGGCVESYFFSHLYGKFGDLAELINGVVLRGNFGDGQQYGTLTNWKRNGDIKTDMFDVEFDSRSTGGGSYGTSGRGTFKEAGAVVRLDGDDSDKVEVYIQDDLTALASFTMKFQGHLNAI